MVPNCLSAAKCNTDCPIRLGHQMQRVLPDRRIKQQNVASLCWESVWLFFCSRTCMALFGSGGRSGQFCWHLGLSAYQQQAFHQFVNFPYQLTWRLYLDDRHVTACSALLGLVCTFWLPIRLRRHIYPPHPMSFSSCEIPVIVGASLLSVLIDKDVWCLG